MLNACRTVLLSFLRLLVDQCCRACFTIKHCRDINHLIFINPPFEILMCFIEAKVCKAAIKSPALFFVTGRGGYMSVQLLCAVRTAHTSALSHSAQGHFWTDTRRMLMALLWRTKSCQRSVRAGNSHQEREDAILLEHYFIMCSVSVQGRTERRSRQIPRYHKKKTNLS